MASVGRSLFVPDAWAREQRHRNERLVIPRTLLGLLVAAVAICGLISLVRRLVRGEGSMRAAWVAAALVVVTTLAASLLDLEATQFGFTVAEPFDNQMLRVALQMLGVAVAGGLIGALVAAVGVRIASRTEDAGPVEPTASRVHRWLPAAAIALLLAGAGGLATLAGPSMAPHVPSIAAANSTVPLVGALLAELDFPAVAAALVLAAAVLSTRRRRYEVAIAAGFVAVGALTRASTPDAGVSSIVLAGVGGLLGWWIYRSQLRDRPGVIAPMLLIVTLLGGLQVLAHGSYPGARIAAIGSLVATLAGYAIWRWLVKRDEAVT